MSNISITVFKNLVSCVLLFLFAIGGAYATGDSDQQRPLSAREIRAIEQRAISGDSDAAHQLGLARLNGNGVDQNIIVARQWLESAAEKGNVESAALLLAVYLSGVYGDDWAAVLAWAKRLEVMIKKPEHARYYVSLGLVYASVPRPETDLAKAARFYEMALPSGLTYAYVGLAELMLDRVYGPPDYAKVLEYLHTAWDKGEPRAAGLIGYLYWHGVGVPKDIAIGRKYLSYAAKEGDLPSTARLGQLIFDNTETSNDVAEAIQLFERVASLDPAKGPSISAGLTMNNQGARHLGPHIINAQQKLGHIYSLSKFTEYRDCAKSIYWLERALTTPYAGHVPERGIATTNMGVNYLNACGVAPDRIKARQWLERAQTMGEPQATQLLQMLDKANTSRGQ